jgi:glycosyltransferase involved in cell wall biosynthesis
MEKILIVLGHNRLTGVNTWAFTLADFLIRRGHQVDFEIKKDFDYVSNLEIGIENLLDTIKVMIYVKTLPDYNSYDYCILNYNIHQKYIKSEKIIFVSHGSMFEPYTPFGKVYAHVAISERTQKATNANVVIHNGIDLIKFRVTKLAKTPPTKALNIYRGIPNYSIYRSCANLNIEYKHIAGSINVEDEIKIHDIIVGYGRSAYEGMASGKPVLVHGPFGTDGWIKSENFESFLYRNCSGWTGAYFPTLQELQLLLEEYSAADGMNNRKLAEKYLSADYMANKFEELF